MKARCQQTIFFAFLMGSALFVIYFLSSIYEVSLLSKADCEVEAMGEIMAAVRETPLLYASMCNRVSNESNVEGGTNREAKLGRGRRSRTCVPHVSVMARQIPTMQPYKHNHFRTGEVTTTSTLMQPFPQPTSLAVRPASSDPLPYAKRRKMSTVACQGNLSKLASHSFSPALS